MVVRCSEALWRAVVAHSSQHAAAAAPSGGTRPSNSGLETLRAITRIGVGGANSGIPFHAHELALNVVVGGRKQWLVALPDSHDHNDEAEPASGLDWAELESGTRQSWGVLGWTSGSWEGVEAPPASDEMDWEELSAAEANAATDLGYDSQTWDAGGGDIMERESEQLAPALSPSEELRIREFVDLPDGDDERGPVDDWRRREGAAQAWRCTQHPGEVVFVPAGFLHTTINVEESLAVAVQREPRDTA